jgi:hypothetical protein
MIDPSIVQLLAGLVQVVPSIAAALTSDAKAAITEQIAAARAALPAPGATSSAVDAVIARHRATPADVGMVRRLAGSMRLTDEERDALGRVIGDVGERDTLPPVLDVPGDAR